MQASVSHVRIYPYIHLYLPGVWSANFPFSICSHRNTDRLVPSGTTIRLAVTVQVGSYYLPPENGFKAYDFTTYSTSRYEAHIHYERIKVMKMIKYAEVSLAIFIVTSSGVALADCPNTMPEQLLNDCIVYEGAGNSFPTSDYAHMAMYQDWMKTHQPLAMAQPVVTP